LTKFIRKFSEKIKFTKVFTRFLNIVTLEYSMLSLFSAIVLAWERNLTLFEGETVSDQACYTIFPPNLVLPDEFTLLVYVDTMDISASEF